MKKILTLTAAALMSVAAGAFAQETQQTSIKFVYGSKACSSGGFCKARGIPTPPEHFLVRGLTMSELKKLNELIEIRPGQDIPANTFVHMGSTSS